MLENYTTPTLPIIKNKLKIKSAKLDYSYIISRYYFSLVVLQSKMCILINFLIINHKINRYR